MNDILINKDNPFLDHLKWNELANANILFNKILTSMLGGKYKGIYDENRLYDKYDYIWKDDNLYFISNKPVSVRFKSKEINNIKKPIIINGNIIYGINDNDNLIQVGTNSELLFDNTSIDDFSLSKENNIAVLKKGNRLIKSNGTKTYGLNFLYQEPIKEFKYDGMYLYVLSEDRIIFGDINSTDNTCYDDIELNEIGLSFDVNKNYICSLDNNGKIIVFNKKNKTVILEKNIDFKIKKSNVKIKTLNDNFLILYDGESKLYNFHIDNNKRSLELIYCYNSEFTYNINSLNTCGEYISFVSNNRLYYTNKFSNVLIKADIKNLIMTNCLIKPIYLREGIDFTNGEIQSDSFSVLNMSNITTKLNKGLLLTEPNSSIKISLSDIRNKTLMISFKTLNEKNVNLNIRINIGGVKFESTYNKDSGDIYNVKFLINLNEEFPEVFVNENFYDGTYIQSDNSNTEIIISGNFIELDSIACFNKILQKDEIDYVINNTLKLSVHETTCDTPYSVVKTNSSGNAMIQTGTSSQNGILKISDNTNSPSSDKAFSTVGANEHLNKIQVLERIISNDVSFNTHKHKFSELLEIPISDPVKAGIVKLATKINSQEDIAATPAMVKKAYDLANHTHPYLNLSGGTVSGKVKFNSKVDFNDAYISNLTSSVGDFVTIDTNSLDVTSIDASSINATGIKSTYVDTSTLYLNGYRITVG